MQIVPTAAVPAQLLTIVLDNQTCQITLAQKFTGMFFELQVNNVLIIGGVICQNLNRIVRSLYLGFSGDFAFIDNQGASDPYYTGLGTRYSLAYFSASELPAGEG